MAIATVSSEEWFNNIFPDKVFMESNSGPSGSSGGNSTLSLADQARWETRYKILESSRKSNTNFIAWVYYIDTLIPKIEAIIEFNRSNKTSLRLTSKILAENGPVPFSEEELTNLENLVKKDPNVSNSILSQVRT